MAAAALMTAVLLAAMAEAQGAVENSNKTDLGEPPTIKRSKGVASSTTGPPPITNSTPIDLSSEFLPDKLPAGGDLVHLALPIFLQEPADAYVVKGRPAELDCRVAHALSVHFQCNDEVQRQTTTEDHVDPQTGIRYTRARVQITRDQVEEFFGDYHCACVAVSGQGHSKSRLAYVTVALLKKEFEVPPYADQSVEGKQVELRCHPPKGKPEPYVYWLKNGARISEDNPNYITTNEGHLIVVRGRVEDSGNYTCVAENLAGRRLSSPAELNIYAAGGWSGWSAWSACSAACGRGLQQRGRVCSSLAANCPGQAVQKRQCDSPCPAVNGDWSAWSAWSVCTPDCKQTRRRTCDNPAPSGGGHYCFGLDFEDADCSGGACPRDSADSGAVWLEPSVAVQPESNAEGGGGSGGGGVGTNEVALYVGLSLAVLVFLLVVLVAVSLVRRRRLPHGYTLTQSGFEDPSKKKAFTGGPDLTAGTVRYEYSYPDSNSNHSKTIYLAGSEHHYEQPMVLLTGRSPVDSLAKPLLSDTSSSSTAGNISPRSAGTFDRSPVRMLPPAVPCGYNSPPPPPHHQHHHNHQHHHHHTQQQQHRQPQHSGLFTRWCTVTSQGARMTLPDSGISLMVPEGAVEPGTTRDLFISVVHDTKSHPRLVDDDGEDDEGSGATTLLSPVVLCGSANGTALTLRKPVVVSFPHVAALRHGNWTVSVASTEDEGDTWREVVTLGQETINTPIYTQLDLAACHIVADGLAGWALLGRPSPTLPAYKALRVAAFAAQEMAAGPGPDLTVRLYCIQDTEEAVRHVAETERQFGGRLLDRPASCLLRSGGQNLQLRLDRLSDGWTVQPGASSLQEVPFSHLWSSTNPNLHCSFALKNTKAASVPAVSSALKLSLQVTVSQEANPNRCQLRVNTSMVAAGGRPTATGDEKPPMRTGSSSGSSSDSYGGVGGSVFRLPARTKENLGRLLDRPVAGGNDWRLLAERLNIHRYTAFYASRASPTEAILNLWEARNRESSAVQGLVGILRGMGRMDCVHLLEHDLQLE